jgi:hypothetical protein
MRTTTSYRALIQHTEQHTEPRVARWEVWLQEGDAYRLLSDQHLRVTEDELAARPLPGGWGRLIVTPEGDE